MKNKFIIFFLLYISISVSSYSLANEFTFKTSQIEVLENGNLIKAINGVATSNTQNFQIKANNFQYQKKISILSASGDAVATSSDNDIQIRADEVEYNEISSILKATGNVRITNLDENFVLRSDKVLYNLKLATIESNTPSQIIDNLGNTIKTKKFIYLLNDNLIKLNSISIKDKERNITEIDIAYLDLNQNKVLGKDISIDLNNKSFQQENEPRIKGNTILVTDSNTIITKGVFTNCKRNDDCPPWQISAKEINHDKVNKVVNYKNAWLEIYDQPVFYFPKFFHPDPTVKRQSGFLMPSYNQSTSLGSSFNIPYFLLISSNKDATITPRVYTDNKLLIQTEYRQLNKTSNHFLDFGLLRQGNSRSKSHFFSKNDFKLGLNNFEESNLNFKIEQTSNDTYLKTYKINSPIINDLSSLTSSIGINGYRENLSFNVDFKVYEDLTKKNNDRFEYIYPNYDIVKRFNDSQKLNGSFLMNFSGHQKNYSTNIYERLSINDLIFNSNAKVSDFGFKSDFNLLFKNINSDSKRSTTYHEKRQHKLKTIAQYNLSYPLKKEMENDFKHIVKPTIAVKLSPSNTKDMKDDDRRVDVNNIFSLNRISSNDSVEGGGSLTYGTKFSRLNNINEKILGFEIANVLRFKENKNLPIQNSLGDKTSDIIGNIEYNPNEYLKLDYDFAIDSNLKDNNYELITSEFKVNNFVTSFEYLNENNTKEEASYLTNKTAYSFNNSTNLSFATRTNKKTDLTEYYNLIYQYRNDCLIAGIEYNKSYYSDKDLKPEENIFFKMTIIPFGEASSPSLLK